MSESVSDFIDDCRVCVYTIQVLKRDLTTQSPLFRSANIMVLTTFFVICESNQNHVRGDLLLLCESLLNFIPKCRCR